MFFIRSASDGDLDKIQALLAETWHATYTPFYGPAKIDAMISAWHGLPALRERLRRQNSEFLVADSGEHIGGMAFAAMSLRQKNVANLNHLYVHPLWQRQGIGSDLFAEIETCFPEADTLRLQVTAENDRAIAFYEAHGCVETGRTENAGLPGTGIPALIMEKALPA